MTARSRRSACSAREPYQARSSSRLTGPVCVPVSRSVCPHLVGADYRVPEWAAQTLEHFRALAADPATGVRDLVGVAAAPGRHEGSQGESGGMADEAEVPQFLRWVEGLSRCDPATLPGGVAVGWRYRVPVISMPAYLDYLLAQLLAADGVVRLGPPLPSLAVAAERTTAPVLVNCAGIGARDLVPDPDLAPVSGQVVVVANPGPTEFWAAPGPAAGQAGCRHAGRRPGRRAQLRARRGRRDAVLGLRRHGRRRGHPAAGLTRRADRVGPPGDQKPGKIARSSSRSAGLACTSSGVCAASRRP